MAKETSLIMRRRFFGRILESGLLIIAVALGIGAAASGLSLTFHTNEYSQTLLNSPAYKEIVISTRTNAEDMEYPALEKSENTTRLSSMDLKKGDLIDNILYSYIVANTSIKLITEEGIELASNQKFSAPPLDMVPSKSGSEPLKNDKTIDKSSTESTNDKDIRDMRNNQKNKIDEFSKNFKSVQDDPSYILTEVDLIQGVEVTSDFFPARNIETIDGSLFTSSDYSSNKNIILIGSELADILNTTDLDSLVGKKIMSWDAVYTIVGVLEPTDSKYDSMFIVPKKELINNNFVRRFENNKLRFYVENVEQLDNVSSQLLSLFVSEYGEGQIEISNPREEANRVVNRNSGISLLILFLSLAGLFIASVNVSNILMSRSLRMKKHVGILKALGASKNGILIMFVKEALFITFTGAILGVCLAVPLAKTMEQSLGLGDVSWLYIMIGVLLSTILTLLFSVLPARQSSAIDPAESMR